MPRLAAGAFYAEGPTAHGLTFDATRACYRWINGRPAYLRVPGNVLKAAVGREHMPFHLGIGPEPAQDRGAGHKRREGSRWEYWGWKQKEGACWGRGWNAELESDWDGSSEITMFGSGGGRSLKGWGSRRASGRARRTDEGLQEKRKRAWLVDKRKERGRKRTWRAASPSSLSGATPIEADSSLRRARAWSRSATGDDGGWGWGTSLGAAIVHGESGREREEWGGERVECSLVGTDVAVKQSTIMLYLEVIAQVQMHERMALDNDNRSSIRLTKTLETILFFPSCVYLRRFEASKATLEPRRLTRRSTGLSGSSRQPYTVIQAKTKGIEACPGATNTFEAFEATFETSCQLRATFDQAERDTTTEDGRNLKPPLDVGAAKPRL
ncbi:hypothetical protein EDD15DRAFT_2523815 [Pisolithus albus]|nr:hypothetical protein EDD15DRAFT_2523815 [Pisolithus albus]